MSRFVMLAGLALAILTLAAVSPASAQYVVYYDPPVMVAPPAPVVTYSYYPPTTVYYAPPTVSYYPPVTTTVYAAPAYPAYSAPVVYSAPGTVTTRSYRGFGVFRPRGVYTQSYYTPSYYTPSYYVSGYYAPRVSYYYPGVILR
jgi:hypothetical protein